MEADDIAEVIRRAFAADDKDRISDSACDLVQSTYSLAEIAKIDKENFLSVL